MNFKTVTGIVFAAYLGCGCINIEVAPKQPPVVVVPGHILTGEDSMVIAEIDAAFTLNFENDRVRRLSSIAQRPGLSPTVQTYLAARALRNISFDNNKVHVLILLIGNPAFCNAAKQEILTNLKKISFDSNKQSILSALEKRGTLAS
ncbi:MAG: hypothetical protein H0X66_13220 [Verrucomicrobia bacterium]|nr:hypothetical protein [Verrucomicrobiota bacterium]